MSTDVTSLWPDDLALNVIRPVTILKAQADKLAELTRGILRGEVTTTTGEEDFVVHRLHLVAPRLENYRHRILTATHKEQFYPVVIEAACYRPKTRLDMLSVAAADVLKSRSPVESPWPAKNDWQPIANSQEEFITQVREVLRSPEVRAVIDSLIARSNERELEVSPSSELQQAAG